jgi:phenylpropionate dioxygenase-like ring-hydroxylating dioxygenase large terminal subunit
MSEIPLTNIDAVLNPIEAARGLPNEHYTSDRVFEEEKQAVLFNNWSAIGFGKDIPEAGDAKPTNFVGMPLLMVRDNNGSINVFQNTCRHRGMILVQEPTKIIGAIRCPYHSWCYKLSGELCATPMVGGPEKNTHEAINYDDLGLFTIRSHVWQDIVFVNISDNAPEFRDYAAKAIERWQEFEKPLHHGGQSSSFELSLNTNWKLAVENYCESYHLPWVHPELNITSKIEDHYDIEELGHFSGQGSHVYTQMKTENGDALPDFDGLSNKWDTGSEYLSFYPNVLLGAHRDHVYAIIIEPISTNKTKEYVSIYYAQKPEEMLSMDALVDANAKFWKMVFLEDVGVVEGMQSGRHGLLFDGGKFSPAMDRPTHCFHHWVATQINEFRKIA